MKGKKYLTLLISLSITSPAMAGQGGIQAFLDSLRDFESGINPALSNYYLENLDNPVYTYAQVTRPGRLVRDCATGVMISEPTTVNEFFTKLGVNNIYNPATPHESNMFKQMQYNSLNAWGFVGYQLGEAVLIDAGYYNPKTVIIDGSEYDNFYMFVPDSTWIGCKTEALAEIAGSGGNQVYVTDTNRWEGTFVGKHGINSFSDLVKPEKQELVIRDAMHFNYKIISKLLTDANMTWEQALAKSWPDVNDDGQPITVKATISGVMAAAHLRGAWGTADLLIKDQITCDEIGTCITKYVHKFGGYDTLFDVPGDSITHGSPFDEVMSAGWGNDTVILGGGKNQLLLNEQSGTTTTVNDFILGTDLIILRGWQTADSLVTMTVSDANGNAELQFAGQTLILKNVNAADILENPSQVIVESKVYQLAWNSGKEVVEGFNPAVDRIEGTAGIGFKHMKAYETNNSVVIGPQAEDGGIYSSYELVGLTLIDLHPDMFINVTGSFDRLGYIVPLDHINWGWNMTLTVKTFDVNKTVLTVPSNQPVPFSEIKLTQNGANTELTLLEPFAQGDNKKIVILNTDVNLLSAVNFSGFIGDYEDVTIDIPIMFNISASVVGTGGTISPTPDANGIIIGQGGSDFTIHFIPDSGYKVKEIIVNNITYSAVNSYTFSNLSSDHQLQVKFEQGNTCPLAWDSNATYVAEDQVTYDGHTYEAQWWNTNNQPDLGGPWKLTGACQ